MNIRKNIFLWHLEKRAKCSLCINFIGFFYQVQTYVLQINKVASMHRTIALCIHTTIALCIYTTIALCINTTITLCIYTSIVENYGGSTILVHSRLVHSRLDLIKEKIQEQWAFKPADLHVNYKIVKLLDYIIFCHVVYCVH